MIDEKVLLKIVADSMPKIDDKINEAYVAQAKVYPQVTELLSQEAKDAHSKLYQDYAKKLSEVSFKIDTADRLNANSSSSAFRSLKADEAKLHNAVYLHELFFANCFDPHSEIFMDTLAFMRLQRDFGTFEQWQSDFMACGLSAQDGWAVCGYSLFLRKFVNTIIDGNDSGVMLGLIPMIVVDMHEHASFRDYLGDKKSYLIAMMQEFNWDVIESRFAKADKIEGVTK